MRIFWILKSENEYRNIDGGTDPVNETGRDPTRNRQGTGKDPARSRQGTGRHLDTAGLYGVVCSTMELLIILNVILLLLLIGTYLSLSGRVKRLEEAFRRHFQVTNTPQARTPSREESIPEGVISENAGTDQAPANTPDQAPANIPDQAEPFPHQQPSVFSRILRSRTRDEWEILFGGKLLNRVGALALIFAVGFFLKYAFDNDWLNETARVVLGGAAGLLLIAGGHRLHQRELRVFAQGLTGAGAAILYLSIYAAYDFYRLIPHPAAFFLMALVTAAALLLSLRYDARAVALLGWAGGFLTPFLLVTAQLNTIGLFVYITLLDAGLIVILLKRRTWRLLEPLGIAATYGTYLIWSFRADLPEGLGTALAFLILWWVLFTGLDLYRSIAGGPGGPGDSGRRLWRWAAVTINALGLYVMLMRLSRFSEDLWSFLGMEFQSSHIASVYFDGVTSAVFALVFFALTAWTIRRTEDPIAPTIYATAAILLSVRAPLSFFNGIGVTMVWSLEALALFWFGIHFERRAVRRAGIVLLTFSFVMIFLFGGTNIPRLVSDYVPVFSMRTGAFWVLIGALLASAGLLRRSMDETMDEAMGETMHKRTGPKSDQVFSSLLHVAWTFLVLVWGTVEVLHYFQYRIVTMESGSPEQLENLRQLAVSGVWLIGGALVMVLGRMMDIRALRAAAIVYFGATVLKVFVFDTMFLDTLYRVIAFLGLSAILIAVSYFYYRKRPAS